MSSLWPSGMIRVYRHEGSGARKEKAWAASWTYGRSGPVSPFGLDMTYVWKGRKQLLFWLRRLGGGRYPYKPGLIFS